MIRNSKTLSLLFSIFILLVIISCDYKDKASTSTNPISNQRMEELPSKRDLYIDSLIKGEWIFRTMRYKNIKKQAVMSHSTGKSYSLDYRDLDLKLRFSHDHKIYFDSTHIGNWIFKNHLVVFEKNHTNYADFPLKFDQGYNIAIAGNVLTLKHINSVDKLITEFVLISKGRRF